MVYKRLTRLCQIDLQNQNAGRQTLVYTLGGHWRRHVLVCKRFVQTSVPELNVPTDVCIQAQGGGSAFHACIQTSGGVVVVHWNALWQGCVKHLHTIVEASVVTIHWSKKYRAPRVCVQAFGAFRVCVQTFGGRWRVVLSAKVANVLKIG